MNRCGKYQKWEQMKGMEIPVLVKTPALMGRGGKWLSEPFPSHPHPHCNLMSNPGLFFIIAISIGGNKGPKKN